jgi:glycosyltransferase involved in cell wall biosynthesis
MTTSGQIKEREVASSAVLMLAFQFPPFAESTGRLRTLSFVRHLPDEGWLPIVVSGRERAYAARDPRTLSEIPPDTVVIRAWGFDVSRAVSIRGIYPRWIATPDRWNTWALGAFFSGLAAVRAHRPRVLWATFPTPSALLAALALHRATGIPLVADLRDPMLYEHWPSSAWDRRVYGWLERKVVAAARAVVVTTPGARALYVQRYRDLPPDRFHVIENGIEDGVATPVDGTAVAAGIQGPIRLIHSGVMESPDRDPAAFFRALRLLLDRDALPRIGVQVVLRASGSERAYLEMARQLGVDSLVAVLPRVSRDEAMREIEGAAGLLLFQGRHCNRQIPAKAYEYLASRKPIIGLMHPDGDTHALVQSAWGVPYVADMDEPEQIAAALLRFFADLEGGTVYVPPASLQPRHMRRARVRELAELLRTVAL